MFIYLLSYCYLIESLTEKAIASIRVLDKGILPLEKNSVALPFFVDVQNEDRVSSCQVHSSTKKCCLTGFNVTTCSNTNVFGANMDLIKPRNRGTLLFIFPTIIQHDQVGYCDFVLDYRCGGVRRKRRKEEVHIQYDTGYKNNKYLFENYGQAASKCDSLDQNSLECCEPIDCDLKYSGMRPFFDNNLYECVAAPECDADPDKDLPETAYEPKSNTCRDLDNPITAADVYAISSRLGVVTIPTQIDEMKVELRSNCSTISQNLKLLRDLMYGRLYPETKGVAIPDYSSACKSAVSSIFTCILGLCALIFLFVFCVYYSAMIYKKWTLDDIKAFCHKMKSKITKSNFKNCNTVKSRINKDVKNKLLKDVIVSDLPMELKGNVIDLCDRVGKEVRWKKRYRRADVGSQINLMMATKDVNSTATSSSES